MHWRLSSFKSHSSTGYEVKTIDWVVLNCIRNLKQNFFFALCEQMRNQSIEFILVYEAFLVALQERCIVYHMTKRYRPSLPPYLVNLTKQRRRILCLYRSTRSEEHRSSLFSEQVHSSWTDSGQTSSLARVLLRMRPEKIHFFRSSRRTRSRNGQLQFEGFLEEWNNRVLTETDAMIEHARRYYSEAFREANKTWMHLTL